jgi:hypothetical protein
MDENGRLPASELAPIPGGRLRKDAAAAWLRLRAEVGKHDGIWICPTSSRTAYRTYAEQEYFWKLYQAGGNLAAHPGTSNHGLGTTVDVPTHEMRSSIDKHGAPFGWSKTWSDAQSEWWHIRYDPGHDDHKGKPAPEPRSGFDYLLPEEKQMRRELMRVRHDARAKGGFAKTPELKQKSAALRKQIMARRAEIKRNAEKGGWAQNDRRQRFDLLGKVLTG